LIPFVLTFCQVDLLNCYETDESSVSLRFLQITLTNEKFVVVFGLNIHCLSCETCMNELDQLMGALSAGPPRRVATPAATPGAGAMQLLLWLLTDLAGAPEALLGQLGLDAGLVERITTAHAAEWHELQLLRATSAALTRRDLAEMLRARVNCLALGARTPAEMAAVARAVRTLPDWVWADAAVSDASGHEADGAANTGAATVQPPASGAVQSGSPRCAAPGMPGTTAAGVPLPPVAAPLNRQQRRAQEARLRKG
jgi:hypothetical protein